jgi:hypothetical protein
MKNLCKNMESIVEEFLLPAGDSYIGKRMQTEQRYSLILLPRNNFLL